MASSFGFAAVREVPAHGFHKVLITGLGRSGTSAIASMLRHAGFYLGDVEAVASREDRELRAMLRGGQTAQIRAVLDQWAANHPLIAWKDPKLIGQKGLRVIASLPDDWALIVLFRDPLAMTMRLVTEHGEDPMTILLETMQLQTKLVQLIQVTKKTVLLVSYEKILADPPTICRDLLDFLDPTITPCVDFAALWQRTKSDQKFYLEAAERKRQAS